MYDSEREIKNDITKIYTLKVSYAFIESYYIRRDY